MALPLVMNWHGPSALSEDLRLFLVDEIEANDLNLRLYTFAYEPETKTLHWRHQVKPLIDTRGGGREVVHDGLTTGKVKIPAEHQPECAELA